MAAPVARPAGFGGSSPTTSKPTVSSPEPVMPTLPEMSSSGSAAASPTSMDYLDEFSQFDQTFGSYESGKNNEKSNETENNNANDSSTLWDVMLSLYLPVMLLWLRRSMFGTANLVRSLILGHFLRLLFGNVSEWMSEKTPSWLAVTLQVQTSTNHHAGKLDPQAWPPPAFVALALLTIFTLVVHPDGFTWIMLGKLRDFMLSLFHSSTQCWNLVVQDYGVIPTIAAGTTFAVLLFLSFCMIRTLAPRGSSNSTTPHPPEKKKKKRKGQARHRGGGGGPSGPRIKPNDLVRSSAPAKPTIPEQSPPPDLTPLTPMSSSAQTVVDLNPCPETKTLPVEAASSSSSLSALNIPTSGKPCEKERRSRMSSVSTLDTTTLSDDQSCESTSVRSIPSVSVGSTRSAGDQEAQQQQSEKPVKQHPKANTPSNNNRRNKKNGKGKSPKRLNNNAASDNTPLVASSRWDALKPKPASSGNNHRPKSPNHHSGASHQPNGHFNSNNNNSHSNNNNHHHHPKHHGRGGGRNNRKGRHQQHHYNNNHHQQRGDPSAAAAANTFFSKNNRSHSPVNLNHQQQHRPRSPVSPPALAAKRTDGHALVLGSNPAPPPPPPGLGPLPSSAPLGGGSDGGSRMMMNMMNTPNVGAAPMSFLNNNNNSNHLASRAAQPELKYVSHSFLNSAPQHAAAPSWSSNDSGAAAARTFAKVKENPFAPDEDSQIEAHLQALGGQMAGSILDF